MGNALKDIGKLDEAIEASTMALSIKPNYAEAHNNMSIALKEQGMLKEALDATKKALSIKPNFAEALYNMGCVLYEQGKLKEALETYKKAILIKPNFAEVYNNMGVTLKDLGNLKDARLAYDKALTIKPYDTAVHRNLSGIKTYSAGDPHFAHVKKLQTKNGLSEEDRCNLNFSLFKMYEDMGDLDEAFKCLTEGNTLRKKLLNYSIEQDENLFKTLKKIQPILKRNSLKPAKQSNGLLPIFIVGMPRSGTTLVEQILSSHSKIAGAGEVNYLSKYGAALATGLKVVNNATLAEFKERYLSALGNLSTDSFLVTDKMTTNFRYIPLICAAIPEAKIINVQRNAAAICWSNFKQHFSTKAMGYCYSLQDIVSYYMLYKDLMKTWQARYNEQIYNLNYEKLTVDQVIETKNLIKYLDLTWEKTCLSPQNNKRSVRTASQQQVRKKIYQGSSQIWHKYSRYLNGAFDNL